jgi:hypothetical protein
MSDTSLDTATTGVVQGTAANRAATQRARDRRFYIAATLALIAIVVIGFWPSYFGRIAGGGKSGLHWVMHFHGAVFSGWMLLLLLQVLLVAKGRVAAHKKVGNFGIFYGAMVFVVGTIVSWVAPVMHVKAGRWTFDEAAGFMILPLVDMVLWAGLFGAAVVYRAKPETHKRFILAATVALAFPAAARLEIPMSAIYLVWMTPMFAGMAYDWFSRRHIHGVYLITVPILTVVFLRFFIMDWEGWLRIGRALLRPFL